MEDKPIGWKLRTISCLFGESVKNKAGKNGINSTIFFIITYLHGQENKGNFNVTQKDLCNFLSLKAPTISLTLQNMEAEGYITRVKSKDDSRNTFVRLTNKGKEYADYMRTFFIETDNQIINALTKDEYEAFCSSLEKIYKALKEANND